MPTAPLDFPYIAPPLSLRPSTPQGTMSIWQDAARNMVVYLLINPWGQQPWARFLTMISPPARRITYCTLEDTLISPAVQARNRRWKKRTATAPPHTEVMMRGVLMITI